MVSVDVKHHVYFTHSYFLCRSVRKATRVQSSAAVSRFGRVGGASQAKHNRARSPHGWVGGRYILRIKKYIYPWDNTTNRGPPCVYAYKKEKKKEKRKKKTKKKKKTYAR